MIGHGGGFKNDFHSVGSPRVVLRNDVHWTTSWRRSVKVSKELTNFDTVAVVLVGKKGKDGKMRKNRFKIAFNLL